MTEDLWLRQAFVELADDAVGGVPVDRRITNRAAHQAIRRVRRRRATRIAVPVVALVALASSAGVAFHDNSSSNRVATAAGNPATSVPAPRTAAPLTPSTSNGATTLTQPVTVSGWTITQVPIGQYVTATLPGLVDFGPRPTSAGCAGKPATAVEVVDNNPNTISSLLKQPGAIPLPVAGTTGVEEPPTASAVCPTEVFVQFEPTPGTLIQVATTDTGLAGAQIVADGIHPAS